MGKDAQDKMDELHEESKDAYIKMGKIEAEDGEGEDDDDN